MFKILLLVAAVGSIIFYNVISEKERVRLQKILSPEPVLHAFFDISVPIEDKVRIKTAIFRQLVEQYPDEDFTEEKLKLRFIDYKFDLVKSHAVGKADYETQTYFWVVVNDTLKDKYRWNVVHLGYTEPYCDDVEESQLPRTVTRCVDR
jgi:hypothetical protein